jgi:starch phosphorylase
LHAGLGNGGLGRLAACFLDSMATMELPAIGYGLRYEFGMFRQTFENGWQHEEPDNWLAQTDPWEIKRLDRAVDVHFNVSFALVDGVLHSVRGTPSSLRGIPYDRPTVGYGGKTIGTLRLWAASAPDYFDDRSRRRRPESRAQRSTSRIQMVRFRAARRNARVRR